MLADQNAFLEDLTAEEYELLAVLFEAVSVSASTVFFRQGDPAAHLYLVLDGTVAVRYKPDDGPQITLTHLHAGDIFGWSSVVGNDTYTADVISETPVDAYRLRGRALRTLIRSHPTAGACILEKLAKAVSPRWTDARLQIHSILQSEQSVRG
jgi:CRP-like cAMP-binding protein